MTYHRGKWKVVCDRCGIEHLNTELRQEWNGLRTCRECWEPRHPQDMLKGRKDRQAPPWTRPKPPEIEIVVGYSWSDERFWADNLEWRER